MDNFDRFVVVLLFGTSMLVSIVALEKVIKLDKQINPPKVVCEK